MSLARLALRLAACEALCPEATVETGPWPTIAGPRVYDSRIDLIQSDEQIAAIENKPLLVVYTEEDVSTPYGVARYPPDEQVVYLVVEAMIAVKGTVVIEQEDGTEVTVGAIVAPITDRQHEGLLDTLEALVRRILDTRNRALSADLFGKVAIEVHRIESYPQRAADRVTRMAARTIKFHVKVKKETWPTIPATPTPTGLDLLPEPLRTVAYGLPPGSTGVALCLSLVSLMQQPVAPIPLQSIAITSRLDGDPDEAAVITSQVDTQP